MIKIPRTAEVFVLASILTVILIYSSITEFHVIAKPPKHIDFLCRDATPTAPGAVKAEVCCQIINGNIAGCTKCQYDANGNDVGGCVNFYPERQMPGGSSTLPPTFAGGSLSSGNNTGGVTNGQTGPPNRLGTVLPSGTNNNTGTPPALTVTKEHNTASPNVLSSTGSSNPSASNGQGQQPSGHHHKDEQNGGGTSSTGNSQSGSTNNNPSSGGSNNGKSDSGNNKNNKK
jgi:hypothetical protein